MTLSAIGGQIRRQGSEVAKKSGLAPAILIESKKRGMPAGACPVFFTTSYLKNRETVTRSQGTGGSGLKAGELLLERDRLAVLGMAEGWCSTWTSSRGLIAS